MLNRVVKVINEVLDAVLTITKVLTLIGIPVLLLYSLYYVWNFDMERVMISGALSLVFTIINFITNGGGSNWRTRRLR